VREGRELRVDVWCKNLKETDSLKDLGTDGKNIKINLKLNTQRDVDCVNVYWDRNKIGVFFKKVIKFH